MNTSFRDIARHELRRALGLIEIDARISYIYNAVGSLGLGVDTLTRLLEKPRRTASCVSVLVVGTHESAIMRHDDNPTRKEFFEYSPPSPRERVERPYMTGAQGSVFPDEARIIEVRNHVSLRRAAVFVMADNDRVEIRRIVYGQTVVAEACPFVFINEIEAGWMLAVEIKGRS